jgi:hypothetical protein
MNTHAKKVLLLQLDGKIPNLALMRISDHHRRLDHKVVLRQAGNVSAVQPQLDDPEFDEIYASTIFKRTEPVAEAVLRAYPSAKIGGTGWDIKKTLQAVGINPVGEVDYTDYPRWKSSIGFSQRGCRLRCSFCVVPQKEGAVSEVNTIAGIWRGDPWPKHILLLDNDFFGQPHWRDRIKELQDGNFKVSFNQGINARMLTDETAEAIASVDYRDDSMKVKRIYTAWDNRKDEERLFSGLERLVHHGVKPAHIMVYILIGYWPGETQADREYRRRKLREFGSIPYPMPYVRTQELVGFQRWIIGAYDKYFSWDEWVHANYQPAKLRPHLHQHQLFP